MFSIDQQGAAKTCNVEVSFGIPIAKNLVARRRVVME